MTSQIMNALLLAAVGFTLQAAALPMIRNRRNAPIDDVDIVVQEGEPIDISDCEASGSYPPTFSWLFNGAYVEQGPLDHIASNIVSPPFIHWSVQSFSSFYIEHALPEHSGKYTCIANSPTKRVTRSYNVRVESSSSKLPTETESNSVRIYEWTNRIMQIDSTPIYVMCRATQGRTSLAPAITWSIDGRQITENDNVKIHSNGDLEITDFFEEFNIYSANVRCTATSDNGLTQDFRETFVYVLEPLDNDDGSGDSSSE